MPMHWQGGSNLRRRAVAARGGTRRRTRSKRRATALLRAPVAAALFLAVAAAPAAAQTEASLPWGPAIDRGVTQLEGAQLPDGGFDGRLPVRDSATAGEALRLARPESAAIARIDSYLAPQEIGDADSLARVALGSPSPSQAAALIAEQNDDGGFGL